MRIALLLSFVVALVLSLDAQAPSPVPMDSAGNQLLSSDETLTLNAITMIGRLASESCAQLDVVKQYTALRQQFQLAYETRHVGFTIDWTTGRVVVKPAK